MYTVDVKATPWGEPENDDIFCGADYDDQIFEAQEAFRALSEGRLPVDWSGKFDYAGMWVILHSEGDMLHEAQIPGERKVEPDDDSDWKREQAMEAGMAFGCDGYNDVMGY